MEESWLATLLKRILPSLLFFGLGFYGLFFSTEGGSLLGIIARALFALGSVIIGAIFIAKPIAVCIAAPLVGLLFPEDHDYSPPPLYRLPEMYVNQGRYSDAVREYQKILRHHPRELRAHLALIEVAFQNLQDFALADKTRKSALRHLKNPEDREKFAEIYQALEAGIPLASSSIASYP